jgi:hypothetical protein
VILKKPLPVFQERNNCDKILSMVKNDVIKKIFSKEELEILKKLSTPIKIQDFLDTLPRNMEKHGDTVMSPRMVLREKKAHCIEGALLSAVAMWYHGFPPYVMDLKATHDDFDHVIAVYKKNGYYGAISKTNHAGLRFRDPVYKTERELAMSYFHEYLDDEKSHKTLRFYSRLIDLRKFGSKWMISEENLFELAWELDNVKHFSIAPKENLRFLRPADHIESMVNHIEEWKKSDPGT